MGSADPPQPATDAGSPWLVCEIDGSPRADGVDLADPTSGPATEPTAGEVAMLSALVAGVLEDHRGDGQIVVGLRFVDVDEMAELNLAHLGHEGPTDVLSFPIDGDPRALAAPDTDPDRPGPAGSDDPPWLLGDIVICPAVAAANAPTHAGTYHDELALLVVHGLLHLLGLDHADEPERIAMQSRERDLLARLHGPLARDPWTEVPA